MTFAAVRSRVLVFLLLLHCLLLFPVAVCFLFGSCFDFQYLVFFLILELIALLYLCSLWQYLSLPGGVVSWSLVNRKNPT